MKDTPVIHAIEHVGDGTGQVHPGDIEVSDISVTVSQEFGEPNPQGIYPEQTVWLSEEVIEEHVAVQEPHSAVDDDYDAVIIIADAPIPDTLNPQSGGDISVGITVDQVRQAEAAECPGCGNDLRETFNEGGCTTCGFYYDGDHLDDERLAEFNRLQEEYEE